MRLQVQLDPGTHTMFSGFIFFPTNCILSEISPLAPDPGACTQKRGLSDPGLFTDPPWLSLGLSLWLEEETL